MNKTFQNILLHLLGSIAFLSIPIIASPDFNFDLSIFNVPPFQKNFFLYILLLIFFYLNYYYLIPKFYFGNKKTQYFILLLLCCLFTMIVPSLFFDGNNPPLIPKKMTPPKNHFLDLREILSFGFILTISFLLKLNNQIKEITNEKLNSEVQFLKAQINPHFLFNTLNSLYALTLTKSNKAPNAVLKLSSLMRYVVTESTVDFVRLSKEINYINDYIDLQKLRVDDTVNLNYEVNGNIDGKIIAPLLLIPFIENAFKYGINPDENSFITIFIVIDDKKINLKVENSIVNIDLNEHSKTEEGMKNTIKRLEIIYPNLHTLEIEEENNIYKVDLTITLL